MNLEQEVKKGMQSALDHLKQELKGLRTSRANPAILDHVQIEVYETQMRLRDIANITTPEARQLLITPFDPANVSPIAKSIEAANLNLQPMVDGNVIRINIPPMDEVIRKEIVKQCKKKGEEAKVSVREVRRKNNDILRKMKADGDLPEDQMKKNEKMIQDMTDKFCKEIDLLCTEKGKEVLSI